MSARRVRFLGWAAVLGLGAFLAFACRPSARSPGGVAVEREYLLANHPERVVGTGPREPELAFPSVEIGHDRRSALVLHPPGAMHFREVPAGPGRRLVVAPALRAGAFEAGSDGVGFEVRCRDPEGGWVSLAHTRRAPRQTGARFAGWQDLELPLESCSEPVSELELRTDCGERGNCAADWALWGDPRVVHTRELRPRPARLVVLVSVDTLRADRLDLYGGPRPTSPSLDRLSRDSVVFEQAIAAAPWTIPSHATLLTSRDPRVHGASAARPIDPALPTLAEAFAAAGWQTAGFVDATYVSSKFGFDRGFEHFDDQPAPPGDYRRGARAVLERLLAWLETADERPAFVFWHLMDVHGPYGAPAPFGGRFRSALARPEEPDARLARLASVGYHDHLGLDRFVSFEDLVASYDEGVAAVDAVLGRFFDLLRRVEAWDEATIVVTSDHGESFLDGGIYAGHGLFLTDAELRVPLIVKLPENRFAGRRVKRLAGSIDVAPTLLAVAGVAAPEGFEGAPLVADDLATGPNVLFGHSDNVGADFVRTQSQHYVSAARVPEEKVRRVHLRVPGSVDLPLARALSERLESTEGRAHSGNPILTLARFRELAAEHADAIAAPPLSAEPSPTLTELERERLEALGYLDAGGGES